MRKWVKDETSQFKNSSEYAIDYEIKQIYLITTLIV